MVKVKVLVAATSMLSLLAMMRLLPALYQPETAASNASLVGCSVKTVSLRATALAWVSLTSSTMLVRLVGASAYVPLEAAMVTMVWSPLLVWLSCVVRMAPP